MPINEARLIRPMRIRKVPETDVPHRLVLRWRADWSSPSLCGQGADAEGEQRHHGEDDRAVAEAEPEPDAQGTLTLAHELAGGVVDGRDVIGVERVPHAERVCRDAQSDPHELPADGVAVWGNECDEHAPANDMQQEDKAPHSQQAAPFVA